jgi:hypothetical protein
VRAELPEKRMTTGDIYNVSDEDKLLTIKLLETPAGKQVLDAFFRELFTSWDFWRSLDKAKDTAKNNGTLAPFEITLITDFLIRVVGPAAIKYLLSPKKK